MNHPLRWLALVALEQAETPTFEHFAAWHAEQFPDAPQPVLAASTDKLTTFTVGDLTAAITLIPRPIPWSQLEGPCATAWYWPEATAEMRDHAAHLLIAVVDEGGKAIEKAMTLTRLTAATVASSTSVGVFWGPGRLVHSPGAFVEQAVQMKPDNLPLFLWIDFRIEQIDDGVYRLYSTGLEALGDNEIEVERFDGEPQALLDFVYNFAHYLIDQKKLIRDGDTIGLTDEVQVTAHRGPSMLGGDIEVIQLQFEIGPGA
jgi:hypothetical protein